MRKLKSIIRKKCPQSREKIKNLIERFIIRIDRTLSAGAGKQILFLGSVILCFVLGFILLGFLLQIDLSVEDNESNIIADIYYHFADPGNQHAVDGNKNKIFVFFVSLFGSILMSGILISTISNIFDRRVDMYQKGRITYKFKSHILIIGYDMMAIGLIKQLYKREETCRSEKEKKIPYWFIIQTTSDVEYVRHELLSHLKRDIDKRILIVHGGRDSEEDLRKLNISACKEMYLLGEENEYDHDALNIESVKVINTILTSEKTNKKDCHVLFRNQSTFAIFQQQDVKEKKRINFIPFNFYETWAEKVLVKGVYNTRHDHEKNIQYSLIDTEKGIHADSEKQVHFVVLGMTSMGIAMGIQVAHIAHYPNFITKGKRSRITFIDMNAKQQFDFLLGRYRTLFQECDYEYIDTENEKNNFSNPDKKQKFTDIEFQVYNGRVESQAIQDLLQSWAEDDENKLLTIAVCFEIPQKSIATALYMPPKIYEKEVPVFVRQNISCATLELLKDSEKYPNLYAFGMLDECYDSEKKTLSQAKHVNYVYKCCNPYDNKLLPVFDEKACDGKWNGLSTAHQWSNIYNVNSIPTKKRSFGKDESIINNPDILELMANVEHNRWNIEKLIMGFRSTTPEEDQTIKEDKSNKQKLESKYSAHTYIKPYHLLDKGAKSYDRLIMKYLWRV